MSFNLRRKGIAIAITDDTVTPPARVGHVLRESDPEEWIEYSRKSSRFRVAEVKEGKPVLERALDTGAAVGLWEALILEVEGYSDDDNAVTELTDEIRGLIPPRHKIAVIEQLESFRAQVEEETRKNSSPPSAG